MNIVQPAVAGATAELTVDGQRITWESDRDFATSNDNFALLASLPLAMVKGGHLHVAGTVDRRLIRNAILIGHYWAQWRPDLYRPFVVSADREIDDGPAVSADAVMCLSGGVDSTYAYLSSVHDARPAMRLPIGAGIFVRGFDYSLEDVEGYDRNRRSISAMAAIPIFPIPTGRTHRRCWAKSCASMWLAKPTPSPITIRSSATRCSGPKSGRWACAIPGALPLIGRLAICISAMSASGVGKN